MLKSLLFLGIIVFVSSCAHARREIVRLNTCGDSIGDLADCEVVD